MKCSSYVFQPPRFIGGKVLVKNSSDLGLGGTDVIKFGKYRTVSEFKSNQQILPHYYPVIKPEKPVIAAGSKALQMVCLALDRVERNILKF